MSPFIFRQLARMSTMSNSYFNQNVKVPMDFPRKTKKPFLTTRKEFNQRKKAKSFESLHPPGNGLLVPELVPVAFSTLQARDTLLRGVHQLLKTFPIKVCRYCPAVHVGPVGHQIASCLGPHNGVRHGRHDWMKGTMEDILPRMDAFHLFDRLGKAIAHEDRHKIPKVPAIVELCIQAGLDVAEYPTKRRERPILKINQKIIEFDALDETDNREHGTKKAMGKKPKTLGVSTIAALKKVDKTCLYVEDSFDDGEETPFDRRSLAALSERTLQAWFAMRNGVKKLMSKYFVYVCGYCPQVHVGPKGTKTRDCRAYKHHQRYGCHGWQEGSVDDIIPLKYVWHLHDRRGPPLQTELRVFYGAAPAIVELCVQAGTSIPEEYRAMMRLDVVIPDISELEMVA